MRGQRQPPLPGELSYGLCHAVVLKEVRSQRSMNDGVQPNVGCLEMKKSAQCHSEAPVFWGPKNPCSFFEWAAT